MAKKFNEFGVKIEYDGDAMTVGVELFQRDEEGGKNETVDTKTFSFNDIEDSAIQNRISVYGLSKILQDRTSDQSSQPDRLDSMSEVFDRLSAGMWAKEREASGRTVSAEIEALAAIKGVEVSVIQTKLRSLDAETRDKILAHPKVQDKAKTIKAAREDAEDLDLDDLAA